VKKDMLNRNLFSSLLENMPLGRSRETRRDRNSMGYSASSQNCGIYLLGENKYHKETKKLLDATKKVGLKANEGKTKYMLSHDS
jgi:hypothetical protein